MGACSSCLNSDRHGHSHAQDDEEDPLLNNRAENGYGSVVAPEGIATPDGRSTRTRASQPDPERLRREREKMERICQGLTGKLIDVSAGSKPKAVEVASESQPAHETAEAAPPRVDYARLLEATLATVKKPRSRGSLEREKEQNAHQNKQDDDSEEHGEETQQLDTGVEAHVAPDDRLEKQKEKLRKIMDADTTERRWDWTRVRGIEGKLTVSFEEF